MKKLKNLTALDLITALIPICVLVGIWWVFGTKVLVLVIVVSLIILLCLVASHTVIETKLEHLNKIVLGVIRRIEKDVDRDPPSVINGRYLVSGKRLDQLVLDRNKALVDIPPLSAEIKQLFKPLTYDYVASLMVKCDDDQRRAATIMAGMKNLTIPVSVMLLDDLTLDYWQVMKKEFDLVRVSIEELRKNATDNSLDSKYTDPDSINLFATYFDTMGTILTKAMLKSEFAPLEVLHQELATAKRTPFYKQTYPDSITGSIATAYAIYTGIMIPGSYVRLNATTLRIYITVDKMLNKRNPLRIV